MSRRLSIEGKQVIILIPRNRSKCVSLFYKDGRSSVAQIKSKLKNSQASIVLHDGMVHSRYVSVIFISVRLIISATWVRQIPISMETDLNLSSDNENKLNERCSDNSIIHESFLFDKAFAQEIKYLFAELDFDLYMCRDKKERALKRQALAKHVPVWKHKEQQQTFVYFVRRSGTETGLMPRVQGENAEQRTSDATVEEYLKFCKEGRNGYNYHDSRDRQITSEGMMVEEYLRLCEDEKEGIGLPVDEYLTLCEKERNMTSETVENYFRSYQEEKEKMNSSMKEFRKFYEEKKYARDVTTRELQIKNEGIDMTVEEYLELCEGLNGLTVEDYVKMCQEEQKSKDVTVEEFLHSYKEEKQSKDPTVKEYLKLCEEEQRSKDITVEEYLRSCEGEQRSKDITVEEYLRSCEGEQRSKDITVEEYLRSCKSEQRSKDITVEEYLRSCKSEQRSKDITVEEYLRSCKSEQRSKDITVEEYLRSCEGEQRSKDITVEEYLRSCKSEQRSEDITVDEYLRSCEGEQRSKDITVEEYLRSCKNEQRSKDITVEEYLRSCEGEEKSKDITVEEYLRSCEGEQRSKDITVEEYLRSCEGEQRSKDITVEEYLILCQQMVEEKDLTVEDYLKLFEKRQKDLTVEEYIRTYIKEQHGMDVPVDEYLRLCEDEKRGKEMTVEEYVRKFREEGMESLTVEDYLQQCQKEQEKSTQEEHHTESTNDEKFWKSFRCQWFLEEHDSEIASSSWELSEEVILDPKQSSSQIGREKWEINVDEDFQADLLHLRLQKICFEAELGNSVIADSQCRQDIVQFEADEKEIVESVVQQQESSEFNWILIDEMEGSNRRSEIGSNDQAKGQNFVLEDCINEISVKESVSLDMEAILHRNGVIYSAELWLLFPPYRRNPWRQISVFYRDDVAFQWHVTKVVESKEVEGTNQLEMGVYLEEVTSKTSDEEGSRLLPVEEESIFDCHVKVNLAEIEFSFLTTTEDDVNNNIILHDGDGKDYCSKEGKREEKMKDGALDFKSKKRVPLLKLNGHHSSEGELNKAGGFSFTPLTSLTKKSLISKSKERIFTTGNEAADSSKAIWSNLERIQCKHAKTIAVPETLRRTVSAELMKVDCVDNASETQSNGLAKQEDRNKAANALMFSPLKIGKLGKKLKESNV